MTGIETKVMTASDSRRSISMLAVRFICRLRWYNEHSSTIHRILQRGVFSAVCPLNP